MLQVCERTQRFEVRSVHRALNGEGCDAALRDAAKGILEDTRLGQDGLLAVAEIGHCVGLHGRVVIAALGDDGIDGCHLCHLYRTRIEGGRGGGCLAAKGVVYLGTVHRGRNRDSMTVERDFGLCTRQRSHVEGNDFRGIEVRSYRKRLNDAFTTQRNGRGVLGRACGWRRIRSKDIVDRSALRALDGQFVVLYGERGRSCLEVVDSIAGRRRVLQTTLGRVCLDGAVVQQRDGR